MGKHCLMRYNQGLSFSDLIFMFPQLLATQLVKPKATMKQIFGSLITALRAIVASCHLACQLLRVIGWFPKSSSLAVGQSTALSADILELC